MRKIQNNCLQLTFKEEKLKYFCDQNSENLTSHDKTTTISTKIDSSVRTTHEAPKANTRKKKKINQLCQVVYFIHKTFTTSNPAHIYIYMHTCIFAVSYHYNKMAFCYIEIE